MSHRVSMKAAIYSIAALAWVSSGTSCSPMEGNRLDKMRTARITIKEHAFEVWIADEDETREKGLMFIESQELADLPDGTHRGMLFVFDVERPLSFWMKNTITALDIAFINTQGQIVRRHTMKPLDEGSYPSGRPAKYALEVKANLFGELEIVDGDNVQIPDEVLKGDE